MTTTSQKPLIERLIFSLGGSLVVPKAGIASDFLQQFRDLIMQQLQDHPNRQFFIVVGGGYTARAYIEAGRKAVGHELESDDLDWLGIHSTRLNGHLVRTIFRDVAYAQVIHNFDNVHHMTEPVVVAAGWRPGRSTDYVAVKLAEDYQAAKVINLSNIAQVYDKDPAAHSDARPLERISWADYRQMVGDVWSPGLSTPFDPIAAQKAAKLQIQAVVMNGDLRNLQRYLEGQDFVGTVIG